MSRSVEQDATRREALGASTALRAGAATLRERSASARRYSADVRATLGSGVRQHRTEPGIPVGEVPLDELVEILTRHHDMAAPDAIIGVAVELERSGYPPLVEWLDGGQALDLLRRVLDDFPTRRA